MGYRFKRRESVGDGMRRVAREQLGKAVFELNDPGITGHDKVHKVRKRLKKIRGLVRLLRPGLGGQYPAINSRFRELGRRLSRFRDAETMVAAAIKLREATDNLTQTGHLFAVEKYLVAERQRLVEGEGDVAGELTAVISELEPLVSETDDWTLENHGEKALFKGLCRSYKAGRRALAACDAAAVDEVWHQWRKRAKDHWYQTRLLTNSWRPVLRTRARELRRLSDLLGDDHDISVLVTYMQLSALPDGAISPEAMATLAERGRKRREQLRHRALILGARVYAEKPGAMKKRFRRYWRGWRG